MELEQYQKLLDNHDWQYEYSDDSAMYYRGMHERAKLQVFAKTNQLFERLYNEALEREMNKKTGNLHE